MTGKPARRPEDLTIDFRQLLNLSFTDRTNMARSVDGQAYLSALTPSQLENLFPSYYKKYLPTNLASAASGAIPFDGSLPKSRLPGTQFEQRTPGERQTIGPSAVPQKSEDAKEGWQKKLERLGSDESKSSRKVSVTSNDVISSIKEAAKTHGWTKEGTAALLGMIKYESSYNPYVVGDNGNSFGLFQVANKFGTKAGQESRKDRFVSILKEKTGHPDPLKHIDDVYNKRVKEDPQFTKALIEASIEHFVYNDIDPSINNKNVQNALKSTNVSEASALLAKATRFGEWNNMGVSSPNFQKRVAQSQAHMKQLQNEDWAAATAVPQQSSSVTGSTAMTPLVRGLVQPQQTVPGAIPPLPEGLDPKFIEQYNAMPQDQKDKMARNFDYAIKNGKYTVEQFNKDYNSQREQTPSAEPVTGDKRVVQEQFKAKRNLPITSHLENQLEYAAEQTGVKVEVFSGGQERPFMVNGKMTSTRHNQGNAADIKLYRIDEQGKKVYLDARNPDDLDKMKSFVRQSVKAGAEGVGFGMNYMGPSSIHIGGGERASWGGSEWIGSELKSGVKERESFNKSGGIKAWIEERKKKIEESNKPTTSNVSAQDVYNPELRKPIEARGITSIGRDSPTAVPVQTVPQTVPEGQTPQQGQTGSPAITGPTPDNKQVQPQYKVPDQTQVVPQEQTKAPSSTQTPVDTENKEQAKGYAGGGEIPTQELRPGENAYVVSQKGEVVAQMNTKREIARTNPDSGKAEIVPMTRTPSETIPQNTKQRQDNQEQRAEQTNKNQETTVKQNAPTPSQAESNPNLRNMHEYNMSVGIPQSPSHQRAMMNSTSFGNPINHYGMKSTTTTIV